MRKFKDEDVKALIKVLRGHAEGLAWIEYTAPSVNNIADYLESLQQQAETVENNSREVFKILFSDFAVTSTGERNLLKFWRQIFPHLTEDFKEFEYLLEDEDDLDR